MEGMKSLNRSSDAILEYSEDSGSPVFTINSSLMLSSKPGCDEKGEGETGKHSEGVVKPAEQA